MKRLHVENTHEIPFLKVCLKDYFCPQDYATHFSMAFSQDVHITKTDFVQTSLTTILSEVWAFFISITIQIKITWHMIIDMTWGWRLSWSLVGSWGSSGFRTVGPVSSTYLQQHFDQDPGLACKNDYKTIIAIPFVKEFKDKYKDTRRIVTAMQFLGLSLNLL